MNITYHGLNCFKIQGRNTTLLLDPKENLKIGLKPSLFKADIVCLSDPQEQIAKLKPNQENIFLISTPGEYEIGGVFIYSFFYPDQQNLIYHLQIEGIKIVHLGNLNKVLDNQTIEKLNGIDILMIPVEGKDVLETDKALEVVNQLEPKIVIPMHYKIPGLNLKLDPVDKFCHQTGVKNKELVDKLKISKKDLGLTELKTIVMKNI